MKTKIQLLLPSKFELIDQNEMMEICGGDSKIEQIIKEQLEKLFGKKGK